MCSGCVPQLRNISSVEEDGQGGAERQEQLGRGTRPLAGMGKAYARVLRNELCFRVETAPFCHLAHPSLEGLVCERCCVAPAS